MSKHKGKPSGKTKPEGTGIPSAINPDDLKRDKKITGEYTDNDNKISGSVHSKHPNRNVNKKEATNAGGYKN